MGVYTIMPDYPSVKIGLEFLECDICGKRFSSGASDNWPLCMGGLMHDVSTSKEQKEIHDEWERVRKVGDCSYADSGKFFSESHSSMDEFPIDPRMIRCDTVTMTKKDYMRFANNYKRMSLFIGKQLRLKRWTFDDLGMIRNLFV